MAENPTKVEDQSVVSSVGGDKNDISPGFSPPIRTTDSPITVSPPQSNSRVPPLIEGEAIDQHPAISQGDLVIAHEFETEDNKVSDEEDDEKEDGYVEVKHDDLLAYRLTTCPELSLGAFYLPPKEPNKPKLRPQLIAHIIATRTRALYVTDASMGIPPNWRDKSSSRLQSSNWSEQPGHQDQGSTIALHSLAVLPEHQGKRLGSTLLKAYVQRIRDAEIANRIALLSHGHLIPFYTSLGFKNRGLSDCTFGGGGWYNMVLEFVNGRRLS
ncbi:conserved hypothetical protein [Histoplasma mississippiense (nom. inval.)]|uniref:conserved hypothetical protein n=1 Tax=Ajellomyces capsulatus (strain NAm1 / WU24) TaxID=2059318 RepID=UPI000157CDD9|nr:conserved hypothetical protein [Histoplasma mississippiense (nom. inval.)]EDN10652.1 conserved hypothetical protein [Histoplasma mississippiense (nom. inval.)]